MAADDDPELAAAVAAELRRMLLLNRWSWTVGFLAYVLIATAVVWRHLDHRAVLLWSVAGLIVTLLFVGALVAPGADWLGRDGLPRLFGPAGYATGVLTGSLFWIDGAGLAASSTAQSVCLVFVLAVSAVVHTPTVAGTAYSLQVQVPMLSMTAVGLAAIRDVALAGGLLTLLVLVVTDARRSRRLVLAGVRARAAAERASVHDPLTGLVNRTGLLDTLAVVATPSTDGAAPETTVMYVDLDRFKQVNDRLGHAAGDDVLRQVADRMRSCFRAEDVVARLGGDEFVVVLGDVPVQVAATMGERVIDVLEQPLAVGDREVLLSASVGIAAMPRGTPPDVLLANADRALYKAKQDGRRRVVRYDAALGSAVENRTSLEMALRRAVRAGEVVPYGQPVFCLQTGRVVSVELLARWTVGDRPVPPDEFIALAEEVGLIRDLGRQMLGHAAEAVRGWRGVPALSSTRVAVNISPLHVVHGLLDDLRAVLGPAALSSSWLVVEITEQHALPDEDGTKEVLEAVDAMGVQVAIDDFGSGFSSIRWLTSLPVHLVKLDRSLLVDAARELPAAGDGDGDRDDASGAREPGEFLHTVGLLARTMSRTAVAEGIETPQDLARVRRAGIPLGQGYLLARPMPLPELAERAQQLTDQARRLLSDPVPVAGPPAV